MDTFIDYLQKRLTQPLPGREAQFRMAHLDRRYLPLAPPDARLAGVLALFYPKNEDWHIVFIERKMASHAKDRHGGQISFPGGKFEEGDGHLQQTALREAHEEVGVDHTKVNVLGRLTELYIPISNFLVNPFVGYVNYTPQFSPQAEEVNGILEVPFSVFCQPDARQKTEVLLGNQLKISNVPYFDVMGKVLWGATAMMMNELVEVVGDFQTVKL
ncbi:MAG: CoA pyrophosphatase [Saprospiraceae bacterium]|nr:CoA pyrophosphatase [Saprospiraceae bacterium]